MENQRHQGPPERDRWDLLPRYTQLCIAIRVWHVLAARRFLQHVDYWFLPSLAFIAAFKVASRYVPPAHPVALMTVLAIAFTAATLALMLLVPVQRRSRD